jgi:NTP pyrophosphatase (non-canonical NTP hydrolase)
MDLNEYQKQALRTEQIERSGPELLTKNALGLAGEAGEYVELVKKHVFHGKDIDRAKVVKELGDVLWYVAASARVLGIDLEEVASTNVEKLRQRYPEGYSHEASAARVDGG